jgi:hypothetical protein
MFNDRVRRYLLTTLLVLAVLMLFGLGAGHLATGAIPASKTPAKTRINDRPGDTLRSDLGGWYVDGINCVVDLVDGQGTASLRTPGSRGYPGPRNFQLNLGNTLCGQQVFDQYYSTPDPSKRQLNLCGSANTVYGALNIGTLFANRFQGGMALYFSLDPGYVYNNNRPASFLLDYSGSVRIDTTVGQTTTTRTVVADTAVLFQYFPSQTGNFPTRVKLGTVNVPCSITVTTNLNLP